MSQNKFALVALYGAFISMALNGIFAKSLPLDAFSITQLRCLLATLALGGALLIWQKHIGLSQRQSHKKALFLGVLMTVHWSAFFQGMMISSIAIGILAHYTYPVFTVILEPLLKKSKPASIDLLLAGLVVFGAALMVPQWSLTGSDTLGLGFGLISALTFSLRNILQRHWLHGEASSQVMFIQVSTVAVLLLPALDFDSVRRLTGADFFYLGFLGFFSTAICHTLISFGLRHISAKTVSLLGCLQVPFAIVFAWWLLGEIPTPQTFVGGSIILAAALYESIRQQANS